ncbi:MAG TPA: IS66 family transposase, partial [Phaeodactylibacter sp.]|nr:IS66 family transposase [Phaeodactylibacter sp.]
MNKDQKISALTAENLALQNEIEKLKFEIEQLKRLIYGSKTERFVPTPIANNQGSLFAQNADQASEQKEEIPTETISYERKKARKKHAGRNKIPEHLPTREVIIEPEEDTTGMKKIGEEVTQTLEYTPASLVKIITRRIKYANTENTKIVIGKLPSRPIEKSIAEASLLAHIFVSKFIDHLPFYRQRQIFKRNYDWDLASSTLNDWFIASCTLLKPLYDLLVKKLLETDYLQADESPIKVLESEKKGATHQGYMWVYRNPMHKIIVFQYRKGRGANGPKEMLSKHKGYLQTDGYKVYDKIAKAANFELLGCWSHARRKFFEALKYDKKRSTFVLSIIKKMYFHEDQCEDFTPQERKKYRLKNTKPLMDQIHTWAEEEQYKVLPKTPIGKAIGYLLKQWKKLYRVLEDGRLELDNNRNENKIRPLALGRKNYLFAGNHKAAQNNAMMYSFFATCKEYNINPYD